MRSQIFPDLGNDGSSFSVEMELKKILGTAFLYQDFFLTDIKDENIIRYKFELEPKANIVKSYCPALSKIQELKTKLLENGFIERNPFLFDPNGKYHCIYIF